MAQLSRKLRAAHSNAAPAESRGKSKVSLRRNPRVCDANALPWDMSQQDLPSWNPSSGRAPRPDKRARLRINFSKAREDIAVPTPNRRTFHNWRFERLSASIGHSPPGDSMK